MTATARQERSTGNCKYVRDLLEEKQAAFTAILRAAEAQVGAELSQLPQGLRDHAFARSGCKLVDGEPILAARSRGHAAESAIDSVTAIRDGDMADARALLNAALTYLDERDVRMVTA